jgi:hypothetical protein
MTPKTLHPSTRRKSSGREFRDAVTKYFERSLETVISEDSVITSPQSLESVISECCLDNHLQFRDNRISHIRLKDSSFTDIICI